MHKPSSEDQAPETSPLLRWIYTAVGFMLIAVGVVVFWLPIPLGIPLMLAGLVLIVRSSPRLGGRVVNRMERSPVLSRLVRHLRGYERRAAESDE
jgi:uncharacterized membrane protein YbaN (DUF454 family)